jgi:tRNA A58 N-methylase Trm61
MNDRMVTPVYGADANLIVSLLDLHVSPPRPDEPRGEALEIFEAGTGHGALTLHLARAIHGANPPPPTSIVDPTPEQREEYTRAIEEYNRNERRAIINTLDVNREFSVVAQKSVRLFRHGMYRHNISFHVSTIPEYLEQRLEESKGAPFLDHAILDLPGVDEYIELVSRCMKPNGVLIAFCPSITQINKCALAVKEQKIPLLLESVKEIGKSAGVGGREWDVRLVRPRKLLKEEAAANELSGVAASEAAKTTKDAEREASEEVADAVMAKGDAEKDAYVQKAVEKCIEAKDVEAGIRTKKVSDGEGWEFVCRPKVGEKVVGGGFIGMFRRMAEFKKEKQEEGGEQGL